jgi:AcrR family transcriptional regulator
MDFIDEDPTWPFSKAKTAVVRAAAAVIRESGPRSATLKNIAAKAGITEPAIFRHFDGVDGLFEGMFFVFERLFGTIQASFEVPGKGLDRFVAGCNRTIDAFSRSKDFSYLILHAEHVFRGYPELRKRITELRRMDQASVFGILEEAKALGQLPPGADLKAVAIAFYGAIHFSVHAWIEGEAEIDMVGMATGYIEGIRNLITGEQSRS